MPREQPELMAGWLANMDPEEGLAQWRSLEADKQVPTFLAMTPQAAAAFLEVGPLLMVKLSFKLDSQLRIECCLNPLVGCCGAVEQARWQYILPCTPCSLMPGLAHRAGSAGAD